MKIWYCMIGNQQFIIPDNSITNRSERNNFILEASKIFMINIVPTQVMSLKGQVPMMQMTFSVIRNVRFRFDLINEIEEGSEFYKTVLKEMDKLEQKNN